MQDFCQDAFWDTNLTWGNHRTYPEFTTCFQQTILTMLPSAWLWLTAPIYLYVLATYRLEPGPNTWRSMAKLSMAAIMMSIRYLQLSSEAETLTETGQSYWNAELVGQMAEGVTLMLVMVYVEMERKRGFVTSGILFIYWFLAAVCGSALFYSKLVHKDYDMSSDEAGLFKYYFIFTIAQLILSCFAEPLPETERKTQCLMKGASFLSRSLYIWMNKFMNVGHQRAISEDDVTEQMPSEQAVVCQNLYEASWAAEERRQELKKKDDSAQVKVSLLKVLLDCHGRDILIVNLLTAFSHIFIFAKPIMLGSLIGFTEDPVQPGWKGFVYLAGFASSSLGEHIFFNYIIHLSCCLCRRFGATLTGAVYKKSLRMSNLSRAESTVGEIVNLLSTDMENGRHWFGFIWRVWIIPVQLVFALVMMYQLVGVAVLAGIAVLLVVMPLNTVLAKTGHVMHKDKMDIKDERVKLMTEVLNGIKILKLYAWEMAFGDKIKEFRDKELAIVWKQRLHGMYSYITWCLTPFLMGLAIFSVHVYISEDHVLTARTAFGVLALLGMLADNFTFLPHCISHCVKAWGSLCRIDKFLNKEDIAEDVVTHSPSDDAVHIEDGQFTWDPKIGKCLTDIDLSVVKGSLVGVVGTVGSGKSSLLSAILGEMHKDQGKVNVDGNIAYVPQQAWIQNATLENNILFGQDLTRTAYDTVIEACALTSDLEILPGKDQTEIGEKGINLSGGQKQRVSLARAVYYNADIYLLDDPLSAVDAHVGKHIFEHVIGRGGLLKNKTRVLVTHGIKWLPFMDKIFVMDKGVISEAGSYTELMEHEGPFAKFIQEYTNDSVSSDEEDITVDNSSNKILEQLASDSGYNSDLDESSLTMTGGLKRSISQMISVEDPETPLDMQARDVTPSDDSSSSHEAKLKDMESFDDGSKLTEERTKEESEKNKNGKLMDEEELETGKVDLKHLTQYISAMGKMSCVFVIMLFLGSKMCDIITSVWLRNWSDDEQLLNLTSLPSDSQARTDANFYYIAVYGALGVGEAIIQIAKQMTVSVSMIRAARLLHEAMLKNILRCPMSFFDTTPVGRIVSRFSRDIEPLDGAVTDQLMHMFHCVFGLFSVFIVISYTLPKFVVMVIPISALYYIIQSYFVPTRRQLSRVLSKKRSPIASHLTESLNGTSVIRAFQCQDRFALHSASLVDAYHEVTFMHVSTDRWVGIRLDGLNLLCTAATTLFAVMSRGVMSGAMVGLAMQYALDLNGFLQGLVRLAGEVESNAVSIERISEYSSKPTEAPSQTSEQPSKQWPERGQVEVKDLSIRYRDGLDLVLKGINVSVSPGEKIGIVGRTGAGKSSLTLGLFRIVEAAEGSIQLDGQDISEVGLFDLRSNLTILPQDPVLFCGTLRINLDPLNVHSDEAIFTALEHAHLKSFVDTLPDKLNYQCGEGGQNLSVGQRQLICLARSLLRKSNILVLDEATAAVDMKTDELIQNTIKKEFKDCTVLTIAHRLNTIIDYDRILVLERGQVKEFDKPQTLMNNTESAFYSMAKDAGLIK